jgi:ankyrin repeat protein
MSPAATDPFELLAAAINANDVSQLRQVLERHPELKSKLNDPMPGGHFGATPLLSVLPTRNRELIDLLLAAGADINARSHWWAGGFGVLDGDHGLEQFLIEHGAVVDAHAAARMGMLDTLNELIAADPSGVHARGGDGQTPLHFAGNVQVAQLLLDHGANINALDIDHESTPAQWMLRDRQDVARFLVSHGCKTDILVATALGDMELVQKHLNADPRCIHTTVNEQWFPMCDKRAGGTIYIWTLGKNKTAHLVSRQFGREQVFSLLMDYSPEELKLSLACELGDEATFHVMLAARPDQVRSLSHEDRLRLPAAAEDNNFRAVKLMLTAGWPVDARGLHGGTALHWASWHGNVEMVREVLRYDSPLELADNDFHATPLQWAIHGSLHGWHRKTGDYAATVAALLDAGAKPPPLTQNVQASEAVLDVLRERSK